MPQSIKTSLQAVVSTDSYKWITKCSKYNIFPDYWRTSMRRFCSERDTFVLRCMSSACSAESSLLVMLILYSTMLRFVQQSYLLWAALVQRLKKRHIPLVQTFCKEKYNNLYDFIWNGVSFVVRWGVIQLMMYLKQNCSTISHLNYICLRSVHFA